jgi:hypothetical protein
VVTISKISTFLQITSACVTSNFTIKLQYRSLIHARSCIQSRSLAPILAVVLSLVPVAVTAQVRPTGAQLLAEAANRTLDCAGADAVIGGSRNTAVVTGGCSSLQIRGDGNVVTISLGAGALIDIEGSGNRIKIAATTGAAPRLRIMGGSTEVTSVDSALAPAADSAELTGDGQNLTLDCAAGAVSLAGARNRIDLRGQCRALTLRGEDNLIRASFVPGAQVLIEGNAIDLIYNVANSGPPPVVTVHGVGSYAVRAGREAALALRDARTNKVVGTVPVLVRDLQAEIVEPGTIMKLASGLFVGAAPSAGGEMQLDRLVALLVQINPRSVRIAGHDANAELAASRATAVRSWLGARGVKSVVSEPATESVGAEIEILALR